MDDGYNWDQADDATSYNDGPYGGEYGGYEPPTDTTTYDGGTFGTDYTTYDEPAQDTTSY